MLPSQFYVVDTKQDVRWMPPKGGFLFLVGMSVGGRIRRPGWLGLRREGVVVA